MIECLLIVIATYQDYVLLNGYVYTSVGLFLHRLIGYYAVWQSNCLQYFIATMYSMFNLWINFSERIWHHIDNIWNDC